MNAIDFNPVYELNFIRIIFYWIIRAVIKSKTIKILITILIFICFFNTSVEMDVDDCHESYQIVRQQYRWLNKSLYNIIYYRSIQNGLNPFLVCSLINAESSGYKYAVSSSGAKGYMQLMHFHTRGVNPYDTNINIKRGTGELRKCIHKAKYKYGRDIHDSLRMYNQGRNAKRKNYRNWKYVHKIMRHYKIMVAGI